MKFTTLELPFELADEITLSVLKDARDSLKRDLKRTDTRIFVADRKEDVKIAKEHIKAMDLIIKYFSV